MVNAAAVSQPQAMRETEAPRSSQAARSKLDTNDGPQPSAVATDAVLLTAAEYKALHEELARLRDLRTHELPRRLREAKSFVGADASEEIAQIQDEQDVVNARIARLDVLLRTARVVGDHASDVVSVGHAVEVEYLASGRVLTYHVSGAGYSMQPGALSARSPVGVALLGRRPGETVAVELPNGRLEALRILSVGEIPRPAA
jgi:transcription elongation factor GreA